MFAKDFCFLICLLEILLFTDTFYFATWPMIYTHFSEKKVLLFFWVDFELFKNIIWRKKCCTFDKFALFADYEWFNFEPLHDIDML